MDPWTHGLIGQGCDSPGIFQLCLRPPTVPIPCPVGPHACAVVGGDAAGDAPLQLHALREPQVQAPPYALWLCPVARHAVNPSYRLIPAHTVILKNVSWCWGY